MNALNSILIEGNLVADPVITLTESGHTTATFTLVQSHKYDDGTSYTSYFEVETWAATARKCYDNLRKGHGVRVVGRLKQDRWEDADGNLQTHIKIVAEYVEVNQFEKQL